MSVKEVETGIGMMGGLEAAVKKYQRKSKSKKKMPAAMQRSVNELLQKRMDKKKEQKEGPSKLRNFLNEIDWIPEEKQVYELLNVFVQGLSKREDDLKRWIKNTSESLERILGLEHRYRICQLLTMAIKEFKIKSPSERYVRKLLPIEFKVEYKSKNASKSSGTSAANNSKSFSEKPPTPKGVSDYRSFEEIDTITDIERAKEVAKYWFNAYMNLKRNGGNRDE
jgi:hypothetical protein